MEEDMRSNSIFAKQMARRLDARELAQIAGGVVISHTFRPVTCAAGGGVDWNDEGTDFEAY
jgi:hypothetical protein